MSIAKNRAQPFIDRCSVDVDRLDKMVGRLFVQMALLFYLMEKDLGTGIFSHFCLCNETKGTTKHRGNMESGLGVYLILPGAREPRMG